MKKKESKQKKISALRKNAEKKLKSDPIPIEKLSEADVRKLAHELQVHQVELEMQNDELRKAQIVIEESRQEYTGLYDNAPVGYFTVDENGLIIGVNLTCATMLGIERSKLIKKPLSKFIVRQDQDKYYLYCHHIFEKKEHNACELKMVKKDGTKFYAQLECAVVQDLGGDSKKCMTVITDITERKQSERRLIAQHAVTQVLAESITLEEAAPRILQAICEALEWDLGEIWVYNQQQCTLRNTEIWHLPSLKFSEFKDVTKQTTFSPQSGLPGRVWESAEPLWIADVVHDTNFQRASVADKVGLHGAFGFPLIIGSEVLGTICFYSREIRKPDNDLLDMMTAIGRQIGLFIKRKQAEEEIKNLAKFPGENPNPVLRVGKNGEIIFANNAGMILLDYWGTQTGQSVPEDWHKHSLDVLRSVKSKDYEIKCNDRIFSLTLAPVVEEGYVNFYGLDITERKKMEERLKDSLEQSRVWLDNSPVCTKVVDLDFNLRYMSAAGIKALKIDDVTKLYGKPYPFDFFPEAFKNSMTKNLEKVKETGEIITEEAPICDIDGNELWFQATLVPVKDFEGRIDFIIIVSVDISERKKMENERWKYKDNLDAIFKSILDGIILVDRELKIVELNESAIRICGFPDIDKARGKKFELMHKYCKGECNEALVESEKTKRPAERNRFECFNIKVGRCLVSVTSCPIFDDKEQFKGCVIVMKDETRLAVLEDSLQERNQFHNIIGKSHDLQEIFSLIETLTDTPTTVLITGESGTGKRLVAEALHCSRKGSEKTPFVVISCSSLSDNLLESELFGHVKGAYTGAVSDRVGRFQKAEGGTVFLDEIGDISDAMQLRLLRIIEERVFERVGDSDTIESNVRIIAATNQDLRRKVRDGVFREDLYHRLKVMELKIPPLRDRYEDIPLLVDHFIEKLNTRLNKNIKTISTDVQKIFMGYKWPGNVRELYNTLEYAFTICNDIVITIDNLPSDFENTIIRDRRRVGTGKINSRQQILQALEKTDWNKAKAARMLGIHRVTIYKMMKKYRIAEHQD